MNTKQLNERIHYTQAGYGHYRVRIMYRGKYYFCTSTNTQAVDRIGEGERSERAALLSLWNECKRANNLK